jgi:DNA-directed RNA polymerase subunit RPC12/RpoP
MSRLLRLGPSSDHRTNRWRITCPACEKQFEPTTTMFSTHNVECPKCSTRLLVDYNNDIVKPLVEVG